MTDSTYTFETNTGTIWTINDTRMSVTRQAVGGVVETYMLRRMPELLRTEQGNRYRFHFGSTSVSGVSNDQITTGLIVGQVVLG